MWAIFRAALSIAGMLGLGATVERWFQPGQDESGDTLGIMKYVRLILIGGVVYLIYRLFGKKISIK